MKVLKSITLIIFKILIVYLLVDTLAFNVQVDSWNNFDMERWLNQAIKSIYVYPQNSEKIFDIIKFLTTISIYFIVEMDSIINISNLTLGFKEVIKYHSVSKLDYIKKVIKILFSLNWCDLLYWGAVFLIPIYSFGKGVLDTSAILSVLSFIVINYLFNNFIALLSKNPLICIILFIIKHLVYSLFIGYEYILIVLIIVIIVITFNIEGGEYI
ncbi:MULTISPECIES: hypothetical protein [Terrabacteria group]|uniref:hypothetical protein n=1 Tax=Bacillati TaxID=1783272 RepID=UPI001C6DD87A|nr:MULTISPECIES: hypothetical protein [Terrabacteria group]MBW9211960.1 hypothetical protein [Trueperella sp. zg.1013]